MHNVIQRVTSKCGSWTPNDFGGADLRLSTPNRWLRLSYELGEINLYCFKDYQVQWSLTFSVLTPDSVIAAAVESAIKDGGRW